MPSLKSHKTLYFSIAYCLFIIYGSLVPLDYHPIPLEQALQSFQQIRYLNLGAGSRADWVANIILYIPLTFSLAAYFTNKTKSVTSTVFIPTFILIFSLVLAITIEFYQQFFPPRTVSQNDLIAETIGSIIGLTIWFSYGKKLQQLFTQLIHGGKSALLASAVFYVLGYLFISFFPYDFITSFAEFENKLTNGSDAFFFSDSCSDTIRCTTKLASEIFLAIPLGILLSFLFKWHPQRLVAIILVGTIFGILIEGVQLLLISGIAQGMSILMRVLGIVLGDILYKNITQFSYPLDKIKFKKYLSILLIPYIILLAYLNGWTVPDIKLTSNALERLINIKWLPFYYHYYTSEAVALRSLLSIFFMYLPIGFGLWLWYDAHRRYNNKLNLLAGLYALILCLIMETSKLFLVSKHPDPTNLLISFAAAFITYNIANLIYHWLHQPETTVRNMVNISASSVSFNNHNIESQIYHPITNTQASSLLAKIFALLIFTLLLWKVIDYPVNSMLLAAFLLLYGLLLRFQPQAWLVVIPALLPVLNLSPWTGRFFLTEFDYFILLTLALGLWYGRWNAPFKNLKPTTIFLFALYAVFFVISLVKGLFPFQSLDANAFSNYYSQYNALRIAKGFFWAIFLLPMMIHSKSIQKNSNRWFNIGILTGLTATVFCAIWERYLFSGIFDYDSDFRITSTFYSMHTGGAHLDAYLALSIPFIIVLFSSTTYKFLNSLLAIFLFTVSLYTVMVTFSRGAYIAFIFAFIVLVIGMFFCYKNQLIKNWKKILWLPFFLITISLIATPIIKGSFIQHRFKLAHQEAEYRSSHWKNAYDMIDSDWHSTLIGMGVGSFPRTYFWNAFGNKTPAIYLIEEENQQPYLKLGSGSPLYIEQQISPLAHTQYKLKLDYRINSNNSRLTIQICEKAVQHSFNCLGTQLMPKIMTTDWQHFEHTIDTKNIGKPDRQFSKNSLRPIKLTLHASNEKAFIDITNISLTSPDKINLISNGNFSADMDHWFFSADEHISWRTENQWIQIIFEQGWIGLILFSLLFIHLFTHLYQQLQKQNVLAAIQLSSFTGFLIIAIIDSPFDMPRITLLFFLIFFISLLNIKPQPMQS